MKTWFAMPDSCSGPGPKNREISNFKFQISKIRRGAFCWIGSALLMLAENGFTQCCPPFFTTQPQSTTNLQGTPATFWAVANGGSSTVTYQWKFNGVDIPGATATNYVIAGVQYSNAGVYTVWGTNAAGGILSSNAILTVNGPPAITNQPGSVTKTETGTATFTV